MKRKNWSLFVWVVKHLDVNHENCLKNDILFSLMKLSGVTLEDGLHMLQEIDNELKRRNEL